MILLLSVSCLFVCLFVCLLFTGDDGEGEEPNQGRIVKRTDNSFTVWCSGRANCDSLLVHIEVQIISHNLIICTVLL